VTAVYGASPRKRSTKAEMAEFRTAVWDIVQVHRNCSVRHTYYLAVAEGLVPKDTGHSRASEKKVGAALNAMREAAVALRMPVSPDPSPGLLAVYREHGIMPFQWITDNTRTRFQADLYDSKDAALREIARLYRRDLWRSQDRHVEVWCESDSIAGVLDDITWDYGVALLPCRGQAPKRFVWDSAQAYAQASKPVLCLYVGDFDPNGLDIGKSVEERLRWYLPPGDRVDVEFRRLAIEPQQVHYLGLVGHSVNPNVSHKQRDRFFSACDAYGIPREAVEAEALDPVILRAMVKGAIEACIDPRQWALELAVEEAERRDLFAMIGGAA
jgi:hypothetical protein